MMFGNPRPMHVLLVSLVLLLLSPSSDARGELIHGTATFTMGPTWECAEALDLSTAALVDCHTPDADFTYLGDVRMTNTYFGTYPGRSWAQIVETPFEEVDVAPDDGYGGAHRVQMDRTYIIKTIEPLYAKLVVRAIRHDTAVDVEFVIQTDGTRVLGPSLTVEPTTWGRVKALYR